MYDYFNGIEDQFFVDIGAFHPVDRSNTQMLKNQGWKGINIDGNYERVKFFYGMNVEDISLNYGVGDKPDKFITMFVSTIGSLSTVS